jgi:hypothetical protein
MAHVKLNCSVLANFVRMSQAVLNCLVLSRDCCASFSPQAFAAFLFLTEAGTVPRERERIPID